MQQKPEPRPTVCHNDKLRRKLKAARDRGLTINQISARFKMPKSTVHSMINYQPKQPHPSPEIQYAEAEEYECPGRPGFGDRPHLTHWRPCPICDAKSARLEGIRSALAGMELDGERGEIFDARRLLDEIDPPAPVAAWMAGLLRESLESHRRARRNPENLTPELVAEAVGYAAARVRAMLGAMAKEIQTG